MTVRDSFIRSFDDAMVLRALRGGCSTETPGRSYDTQPVRNIRMSGLVVWCDWGRALEIGAETCAPEIADVVFRDIDIIRSTHIAMDIQHSDRAAVHDIRYENIRVEVDDFNPVPTASKGNAARNTTPPPGAPARALHWMHDPCCQGCVRPQSVRDHHWQALLFARIRKRGTVRDVTFKDISVTGKPIMPSSFTGFDAEHDVRGVTIENLRFNGRPITNAADAHLQIGKYVQDVRFVASGNQQ